MWPGASTSGDVPSYVEVPLGYGAILIQGVRQSAPEYEPFAPTSYYFVVKYTQPLPQEGDYYFAVYEPNSGGRYNLAVGYVETFTLTEWLKIPYDVMTIHIWEGQSLLLILAPMFATVVVGYLLLIFRFRLRFAVAPILGSISGLLCIGSGSMMTMQMLIAAEGATATSSIIVTLIFAAMPIAVGALTLRTPSTPAYCH